MNIGNRQPVGMKMMTHLIENRAIHNMLSLLLLCLAACTETDYKMYDTSSQKDAVYFEYKDKDGDLADSLYYMFNYDIANEHPIELPIKLMGMPAEHDRTITVEAVPDSSNMTLGVHYDVEPIVLPAGAVETKAVVKLLRKNDPELLNAAKHVTLRIKENNDLRGVGQRQFKISYSDIRPELRPEWWSSYAPLPEYSFEAAQLFFEYFNRLAPQANATLYQEMMGAYGEYFVKAVALKGPFAMYSDFITMYVLIPLYKDHGADLKWQQVPSF